MFNLTDEQKIQLLLVGAPIVSLVGTWMSLRTYGRLRQQGDRLAEAARLEEETRAEEMQKVAPALERGGSEQDAQGDQARR